MITQMIKIIPEQKAISIKGNLFADNIRNYRLLSAKNLLIKGPITRYYDWPCKYPKPMGHQVVTADFMCRHRRGYVFNDIGTGKTLIMDWTLDFLKQEKEVNRVLIISPLSTLQSVHGDEIDGTFGKRLSYAILHGTKQQRLSKLNLDVDVYIINPDGLKVIEDEIAKRRDINLILIDEIAEYRNAQTAKWKVINRLFGYHTGKMVWGFTGSPMPKAPTDAYGQARLIRPDNIPQQRNWRTGILEPIPFYKFRELTMYQKNEWLWLPRKGWEDTCYKALQPSIRFTRDECIDSLPPTTFSMRDVHMSEEQKRAYKEMSDGMRIELDGKRINALNEGAKILKLLQIASGAVYDTDKLSHPLNFKPKLDEVKAILNDCTSNLLIFVPFKNILTLLKKELSSIETVDSDVTPKRRTEIYADFNAGRLRIIAAIPSCMSHGLNLQHRCSTIVWWSPPAQDRYDIFEQACGRITRSGQTKNTHIICLQSAPVERILYKKLKEKEKRQNLLLDILKEKV